MQFDSSEFIDFLEKRQVYNVNALVNIDISLAKENNIIPDYVPGSEDLYEAFGFDSLNEEFLYRCKH